MTEYLLLVVSAVLATGNTAIAAISRLKEHGARDVKLVTLVATPPGLDAVGSAFPDVPVLTAAVDPTLDGRGYIVPGLGDAGDRIFGTK